LSMAPSVYVLPDVLFARSGMLGPRAVRLAVGELPFHAAVRRSHNDT